MHTVYLGLNSDDGNLVYPSSPTPPFNLYTFTNTVREHTPPFLPQARPFNLHLFTTVNSRVSEEPKTQNTTDQLILVRN